MGKVIKIIGNVFCCVNYNFVSTFEIEILLCLKTQNYLFDVTAKQKIAILL